MNKVINTKENLEKLSKIKLFTLDMDGTIYLDSTPLDGAIEFCNQLYKRDMLCYFTNNTSKNPMDYVEKLGKIGFPAERRHIITSGDVTIAYLNKYHKGEKVYLLGTKALEDSFLQGGINLSENAKIVVVGFDMTLTYKKLEHACTLIRNGAKFYSTHPDINCPTKDGFIPDSGAICAAIQLSTGVKPRFFGKPNAETVEMLEQKFHLSRDEICMVGDRLYTDIALGKKNNMLSILVMTGETTEKMLDEAEGDNVPDLVFDKISDIPLT